MVVRTPSKPPLQCRPGDDVQALQSTLTTSLCNIARFPRVSVCLLGGHYAAVQPCSLMANNFHPRAPVGYFDYAL